MSEPATQYQAIKGEGGEPQLGEGGEFILPEGGVAPIPVPPPPMPVVVALCPGVECCDLSPFVYIVRRIPPTLTLATAGICSTCLNASFSTYIVATGIGPALTWTIQSGALPTGLSFHGGYNENGKVLIDGTPTVSGPFTITVKAVSPTGASAVTTITLTVFGITTTSIPNYVVGQPYMAQLAATGGSGNYGWSIQSGALPDGLALNTVTGSITGTPTGLNSGTMPIVFHVEDTTCEQSNPLLVPQGCTKSLTLSPIPPPPKQDTTTVVTARNCNVLADTVTYTAVVTPVVTGVPSGNVIFTDGISVIGTVAVGGGIAVLTVNNQTLGAHTVTASYQGDGNFNSSNGTVTINILNSGDPCGACEHVYPHGPLRLDASVVARLQAYDPAFTGTLVQRPDTCPYRWDESHPALFVELIGTFTGPFNFRLNVTFYGELTSAWAKIDPTSGDPRGEYYWFGGPVGLGGGYPPSHIFVS